MVQNIDVLVVDDARDAAESLALVLAQDGYDCRYALSGDAALAALEVFQPLCVILDFQMPGMDGLELAKAIRQRFKDDVILVAMTGFDATSTRVAETFNVVDHYFMKPIPSVELAKIFPPKGPRIETRNPTEVGVDSLGLFTELNPLQQGL